MTASQLVKSIADKTGASPTTVRRVLRGGNKEVWPGAAERAAYIRATARALGFLSNASASAVRKGRFDSVLLVLGNDPGRSNLPELLLHSICASLEEKGKRLSVARCADTELSDPTRFPAFLAQRSCDGVIVNYTHGHPDRMEAVLNTCGMPFVWLNAPFEENCVRYGDFGAGRRAARQLIDAGHRRLAWLDLRHRPDEKAHYSAAERKTGFLEEVADAGLPTPLVMSLGGLECGAQRAELAAMMNCGKRPTGLAVYDRADRVLLAAASAGLSVPRDLSMITFAETGYEICGISPTLLAVPSAAAGRLAVKSLLRRIASNGAAIRIDPLDFDLEEGETLAPPRTMNAATERETP